jgi:regulator of cell morphogenesis and NO signaling
MQKLKVNAAMRMSELIFDNPMLLFLLEHLDMDFTVGNKTVSQLCIDNGLQEKVFVLLANLYNGHETSAAYQYSPNDILLILRFLKNSHDYYKNDKYPEILSYIKELQKRHKNPEVNLVETFFNDYFVEVLEHLDYEDQKAFPYFSYLIGKDAGTDTFDFSVREYSEHHSDIETKLADLKNLLLKHIKLDKDLRLRRKLLISLFELEYDLHIHSRIEEEILLPFVDKIERSANEK